VEFGSGFAGSDSTGSQQNDAFTGVGQTSTNHSGGIQGGISNSMPLEFSVAFKPIASIRQAQQTVTREGDPTTLEITGRHDPAVLPRALPIVEAMTALVLADFYLAQRHQLNA
jgi:chorismate synthase